MRANWKTCGRKHSVGGYTLLELIITVAIVGIAARFILPGMGDWTIKRDYRNILGDMERFLLTARQEAETRHTTVRAFIVRAGDVYTITTYASTDDPPASDCDANGNWDIISTRNVELPSRFEITGSGVGHVCFYRNGSASGGTYNLVQKDGGTEFGSATITVTIATGTPDTEVGG